MSEFPKVTWSKDRADAALAPYREAIGKAVAVAVHGEDAWYASLLLHVSRIPGMCPNEKIDALYSISRDCPHGDVVEIGTWWGKSALALLLLARRYDIGNVLCIDPWRDEELVQGVPSVDEASAALSAEEAFEVFKMNLLPYVGRSDFNYVRDTSAYVNKMYSHDQYPGFSSFVEIISEEFGGVRYERYVALLHIDGNHAYEKVKQDVELWTPLVVPGGWIVIDDYDWRHGDGPRRAADEYLVASEPQRHFVAGGAMFIQTKGKT